MNIGRKLLCLMDKHEAKPEDEEKLEAKFREVLARAKNNPYPHVWVDTHTYLDAKCRHCNRSVILHTYAEMCEIAPDGELEFSYYVNY